MEVDLATIEKGSDYLGMVASIPPDDQFTRWKSEYKADILVALASLAGERLFFDGDNSSGVSGDLESATTIASFMEGHWGMGSTISSHASNRRNETGTPGGTRAGKNESGARELQRGLADRIEANLAALLKEAESILKKNRGKVLSLAHALEVHKTISGDDLVAVMEGGVGPLADGRPYLKVANIKRLEEYHKAVLVAHKAHQTPSTQLPNLKG
jgi:ATP-dependent Zn protease